MRKTQAPRAAWEELYRAALVEACGYAAILGLDEDAQTLFAMTAAAENQPEQNRKKTA